MNTPIHAPSEEEKALQVQLLEATDGLLYPSETDAVFTFIYWQSLRDLTKEKLLLVTRNKVGTPIEETTLDRFFEGVTREEEWMDDGEHEHVKRFQNLKIVIQDLLSEVKVFRLGAMDIDVYVVGKTLSGVCAGVATKVVET